MSVRTKRIIVFVVGCLVGIVVLIFGQAIYDSVPILLFPARVGSLLSDAVLWLICKFNPSNICRGLGLDGGPLVWIEWTGLYGGLIVGYGLIVLLVYEVYVRFSEYLRPRG